MGASVVSLGPAPAYAVAFGASSGAPPAPAPALRGPSLPCFLLTVHQLLAHTSGLDGAAYFSSYATDAGVADVFPELDQPGLHPRAMRYGLKDAVVPDPTLVDEPNNNGNYSNAGYRILGAIIDAYTVGDLDGAGLLANGTDIASLDRATLTSAMTGFYELPVRGRVASTPSTGSSSAAG